METEDPIKVKSIKIYKLDDPDVKVVDVTAAMSAWQKLDKTTFSVTLKTNVHMDTLIKLFNAGVVHKSEVVAEFYEDGVDKYTTAYPTMVTQFDTLGVLEKAIPGFRHMMVKYPGLYLAQADTDVVCLPDAIMWLNDKDGWSREKIADWLDELDYDLTIRG